jgi:hypothetical protein
MSKFLIVIDRGKDERPYLLGDRSFDEMPRVGEFIVIEDESKEEKFFKVNSVIHVISEISEATTNSGEILVRPANIHEEEGLKFYWTKKESKS